MSELLSLLGEFSGQVKKKVQNSKLLMGRNHFFDKFVFESFEKINNVGKALSTDAFKKAAYQNLMDRLLETMPSYDSAQPLLGSKEDEAVFLNYKTKRFLEAAQPCDVVLVRGNQRISRIIQTLTTSPYSHSAFYLGNGEVLEVEPEGVIISPISKYIHLDLRICRPSLLEAEAKQKVLDFMQKMLQEQPKYDVTNIEKLMFKYVYSKFRPDAKVYIGGNTKFETYYICSGMIAHAFQKAGYPIVPSLRFSQNQEKRKKTKLNNVNDYFTLARHRPKNFSQVVPADFDTSPFFATVKFMYLDTNIEAQKGAFEIE
ncbi:MAG: hypothetical protein QNL04_12350 [SAR324 cluster bacterium]|nr:hypothetical protein [SAR324 cluster bacterium]